MWGWFRRGGSDRELGAVLEGVARIIEETRKTYEAGAEHALRVPKRIRQVDVRPEDGEVLDRAMQDEAFAHVVALREDEDVDKMREWLKKGTRRGSGAEPT